VRDLERQIAKVLRKSAREIMEKPKRKKPLKIGVKKVSKMLGVEPHDRQIADGKDRIGAAVGLAWTATGGELLMIESESMTGKGTLTLTGSLGDVMQESARAALTSVRSRADQIGFKDEEFLKKEVHVHFPEGAVSKDGPSAGITIAVALASNFSRRPVRGDVAMTGEITLRGEVLPIGGLREKLMAAVRADVKTVIIPERNQRELSEVPDDVLKPLEIIPVKTIDNVFDVMLLPVDSKIKSAATKRKTRKTSARK